jgi:hypothetical protein
MSTTAPAAISPAATEPVDLRLAELRQMVLDSVVSEHSKRNYAKALDDLFLFAASRPLTRALLMEWRAAMNRLSPSIRSRKGQDPRQRRSPVPWPTPSRKPFAPKHTDAPSTLGCIPPATGWTVGYRQTPPAEYG